MLGIGLGLGLGSPGAAGAWSPLSLSPIGLWNAATLSSLYLERSSPATLASVNGAVGTWQNLGSAGSTADMVAPSDAARPVLKNSGTYYWLEGDGVDDRYVTSAALSALVTSASSFEICAAIRFLVSANNKALADSGSGRLTAPRQRNGPDIARGRIEWDGTQTNNDLTVTVGSDFVYSLRLTGGNVICRVNNGTDTSAAAGDVNQVTNPLGFFGDTSGGAGSFANARIYAFWIGPVLSSANRLLLRTWMGSLCGVSITS